VNRICQSDQACPPFVQVEPEMVVRESTSPVKSQSKSNSMS
jgi:hypothetical protein